MFVIPSSAGASLPPINFIHQGLERGARVGSDAQGSHLSRQPPRGSSSNFLRAFARLTTNDLSSLCFAQGRERLRFLMSRE